MNVVNVSEKKGLLDRIENEEGSTVFKLGKILLSPSTCSQFFKCLVQNRFRDLLGSNDANLLQSDATEVMTKANLESLIKKSPFDWKCVLVKKLFRESDHFHRPGRLLSMTRANVCL